MILVLLWETLNMKYLLILLIALSHISSFASQPLGAKLISNDGTDLQEIFLECEERADNQCISVTAISQTEEGVKEIATFRIDDMDNLLTEVHKGYDFSLKHSVWMPNTLDHIRDGNIFTYAADIIIMPYTLFSNIEFEMASAKRKEKIFLELEEQLSALMDEEQKDQTITANQDLGYTVYFLENIEQADHK
jgi:hypothetical protein